MTVRISTTQHAFEDATIRSVKVGIVEEASTAPPRHDNSDARAVFVREDEGAIVAVRVCIVVVIKRRFIELEECFIILEESQRVKGNPLA